MPWNDKDALTPQALNSRSGLVFNVKDPDFGAVGDGATDDTAAIQAAINAITNATGTLGVAPFTAGGVVYIPPSDNPYIISSPLILDRSVWLIGGGPGSMLYLADSSNVNMIEITHGGNQWIVMSDLSLEGNRFNQAGTTRHGIVVNNSGVALARYYDLFKRLYVRNCRGNGFEFVQGAPHRIRDCLFHDNSVTQIHHGSNTLDCYVEDTVVGTDATEAGTIGWHCEGSNVIWRGGAIALSETGAKIESGFRNTIDGASVDSNNQRGIHILVKGTRVLNCTFLNNSKSPVTTYPDIDIDGSGVTRTVVSGNHFDGADLTGLAQATFGIQETNSSNGTKESGNVFVNHSTADISFAATATRPSSATSRRGRATPTYSATISIDPSDADVFLITVTDGVAFSVGLTANKSSVPGQMITVIIKNGSGGAAGTLTWSSPLFIGAAWTQPADTKTRSVTFRNIDGTNWVEISRVSADV